jgi:hypothetical protein
MADTLTAIALMIALVAVMFAAVRLLVMSVTDNADKAMDFHNIHHIRHMLGFGDDTDLVLTYIVPKERTLWEKLTRRVGIWAWECDFFDSDMRRCKRYVTVSTSSYFYMKLKGWTETSDKELAQKAMDYMKWEREIP